VVEHDGEQCPSITRVLGNTLRRHRERAGLSLRALAEKTTYGFSYIARVERGEQLPSDALARELDDALSTGGAIAELLEVARETSIPDYGRASVHAQENATRIQVFTSSLIPGLMQTEGYARELFRRSLPGEPEDRLTERVAMRMHRKRIFDRDEPPHYWAIMDESALRRMVGDSKTMVEQIHYVLQIAGRPHFTLQVLPFTDGAHPFMGGSLILTTLPSGGMMAFVESFDSGETVELPKRVIELTERFDVARSLALSGEKSLDLIRIYLRGYENDDEQENS
jgi:transcriptional regulator with XRE-family HTH domain